MSVLRVLAVLLVARVGAAGACTADKFPNNRVYAACSDLPTLGASLHWTYDGAVSLLSVAFVAAPPSSGGWLSWGLNPTGHGMEGTQALVAAPKGSGGGVYGVQTYDIQGLSLGTPGPIAYPTSDLAAAVGADGRVQMFGKLTLHNGTRVVNQVWQVGQVSGGSIAVHAMASGNKRAKGKLNLVTGATGGASGGGSSIITKRNAHGILNAVSWGILLPLGGLVGRYLKTFKQADPAWFYLHVACQLIGYGEGVSGWATGIHLGNLSKGITYSLHRNIGIAVFALGTLQMFALFLRPKKDHKLRVYWNMYHRSVGYTIIILGVVNIFKGMTILDVEHKWKVGYIIAIGILGGIGMLLEVITWSIILKRSKTERKAYDGGHLPLSV